MSALLRHGHSTSPQHHAMFDADHIFDSDHRLVDQILNPSRYQSKPSIRNMLSIAVREDWARVLSDRLINKDYIAVDNSLNLKVAIDLIILHDERRYVCKVCYVSSPRLQQVVEKGPFIHHVASVNAACYMTHCHDGLIFYQHGTACKIFHVRYNEAMFKSTAHRCKKLNDYVLLGKVPPQEKNRG